MTEKYTEKVVTMCGAGGCSWGHYYLLITRTTEDDEMCTGLSAQGGIAFIGLSAFPLFDKDRRSKAPLDPFRDSILPVMQLYGRNMEPINPRVVMRDSFDLHSYPEFFENFIGEC